MASELIAELPEGLSIIAAIFSAFFWFRSSRAVVHDIDIPYGGSMNLSEGLQIQSKLNGWAALFAGLAVSFHVTSKAVSGWVVGCVVEEAKKKDVYKGRKPSIDPEAVKALKAEGKTPTEISRELGISRPSVYRLAG